jgi:hypothetical protein
MKKEMDIARLLSYEKKRVSREEELLAEANRILVQNRLADKNILDNLKFYTSSFEFLDEEEVEAAKVFTLSQIRSTAMKLRLRFLPSQDYEGEIPYEAVLKIKELNRQHRKELKHFKILSTDTFFADPYCGSQALLFAQTLYGNYYLAHSWGKPLKPRRKMLAFPLRSFEMLALCLLTFTLLECLVIPNHLLSTDTRADYFSMYRIAAYFHLLILNAGLMIFLLFAFHLNFSEQVWNTKVKQKKS